MEKYKNSRTRIINLKYQLQLGMNNLSCQIDYILYQRFKVILNTYSKSMGKKHLIL